MKNFQIMWDFDPSPPQTLNEHSLMSVLGPTGIPVTGTPSIQVLHLFLSSFTLLLTGGPSIILVNHFLSYLPTCY